MITTERIAGMYASRWLILYDTSVLALCLLAGSAFFAVAVMTVQGEPCAVEIGPMSTQGGAAF